MTTLAVLSDVEVEVRNNGRVRVVPVSSLTGIDADIDAALSLAQESRGTAVPVSAITRARGMRPRYSVPASRIIL